MFRWLRSSMSCSRLLIVVGCCAGLIIFTTLTSTEDSTKPKGSLFRPYASSPEETARIREENMKKYSFKYNKNGIDRRSNLSLQEYFDVYDAKWPVIITDVIPKWPAFQKWTEEFFVKNYGMERVTMKAVAGEHASAQSFALPLKAFYEHINQASPRSWTYINDELFIPMRPKLRSDIGKCEYLEEDFYKLFPEEVRPWDAMLLWGTQHSRSALHIDPYNWTGTNAVISGRKKWKLYPPYQDELLYVYPGRTSGFPLDCPKYNSPVDGFNANYEKYPKFRRAKAIEFDQMPGDLVLIPSGWFHQVYNAEPTLAISSQVMNRNNHRVILEEILKVNNVKRSSLPSNIDTLSPRQQVITIMSLLPKEILRRGREITKDILKQIKREGSRHTEL